MKKKFILPFEDHPYAIMYHNLAFPMGILQANAKEDITPFLCEKYINCIFAPNDKNKFIICSTDNWMRKENFIFQQRIDLLDDLFKNLYGDFIKLFRKMMNLGFYPHGFYNEKFIPGKRAYQDYYYWHDYLIIGYDDIKQIFYSVGYLKDQQFQRFEIPYENMRMAIESLDTHKTSFNFWAYNHNAKFKLNLPLILGDLKDYLSSTTLLNVYSKDKSWGIKAIQDLGTFFVNSCNNGEQIDYRYSRGLMEHKFFMQMRMEHLFQGEYLHNSLYTDLAKQTYEISEKIHLLVLKFNITQNKSIATRIDHLICRLLELEQKYLPQIVYELQSCMEE